MEIVYALAIGVLAGSGVWLILRPRTFQVLLGLTLVSYSVNLFIFGMGRLAQHKAPVIAGNAPWATVAHWLVAMTLLALVATTAIRGGALGGTFSAATEA